MIGDLGDIGPASLSYKNICYMIESLLEMTDAPDAMQFELIARLLACGQRVYLCRTEWMELDDPFKSMERELELQSSNTHYHSFYPVPEDSEMNKGCSDRELSESPFACYILRHFGFADAAPLLESQESATSCDTAWHRIRPLLSHEAVTDQSLVTRIGALTAAVELYPLGACWASDSLSNWITVKKEVNGFLDILYVKGSSLDDLASVIDCVGSILERTGTSKIGVTVQSAALLCLIRLVEASQINFNLRQCPTESYDPLRDSFTKLWKVIFSGDFFYGPPTRNCERNSTGDLVLRLLQQLVCFPGFDSNELHRLQLDIWNLPAFSSYATKNPAIFWLLYSVVRKSMLVIEGSEDSIVHSEALYKWFPRPVDRHERLLMFCVSHFQLVDMIEDDEILTALTLCLSILLHGSSKTISILPLIREFSRNGWQQNNFDPAQSFPMTREEDIFRTLWANMPCYSETKQLDVQDCSYGDKSFSCSLSFCLRFTPDEPNTELLPNVKWSERFFAEMEKYLSEVILHPNLEADDGLLKAPSASGCLGMLKIFMFTSIGSTGLIVKVADLFGSVLDRVDFDTLSVANMTKLLKLSSQMTRALVKMGCSDKAGHFSFACTSLKGIAAMILSTYSLSSEKDVAASGTSKKTLPASHDEGDPSFGDAEMFGSPISGGKRKAESHSDSSVARKRFCRPTWLAPGPDYTGTFELSYHAASLLLTINPIFERILFVCKALAGEDCTTVGQGGENRAIDVEGAKALIHLLCRDLLYVGGSEESTPESSVTILVLNMLRILRSLSPTETKTYLYGFDICKQIVWARDGSPVSKHLDVDEAGTLIEVLDCQEKNMSLRPELRIHQMAAADSIFENAQSLLHVQFDNVFTSKLVSPFLLNINSRIRSRAAASVGLALKKLDKHEIIESVRKELAQIVRSVEEYRVWYIQNIGGGDDASIRERQLYEDAREGFVHDVISTYWVIIVVNSKDPEVVEQMVFDYVRLAATLPDLQSACFQSLDRVAKMLGFGDAESLLFSHRRSIAHRWLSTEESLFEIPILVTAPSVVRRLIRFCRGQIVVATSTEESIAYERLSDFAASRFLELSIDEFVPQIVVSACREIVETAITTDGRRFLLRNEYLRQMSSIFFDKYDDETVRKLLIKSLPAINAEKLILLHSQDKNQAVVAQNLEHLLDRLVSNTSTTGPRTSLVLSLKKIVDVLGAPGGKNTIDLNFLLGDISKRDGSTSVSSVEILLFAYDRLLSACSRFQCILRWQPIEQICSNISHCAQSSSGAEHDLLFSVKLLSDCLTRETLAELRTLVCHCIKSLLTTATKLTFREQDLSIVARNLLGNAFEVHNAHQQQIVAECDIWYQFSKRAHAAAVGFLEVEKFSIDAWGWHAPHTGSSLLERVITEETRLVMKGTFDIITFLISEQEKLMLSHQAITGMWRHFSDKETMLTDLGSVLPELSAQLILKRFAEKHQPMEDVMPDTSLIGMSNKALQKAEIEQLEQALLAKRGFEDFYVTRQLVVTLVTVAMGKTDDVRCAASRCIGELYGLNAKYHPVATAKVGEVTILRRRFFAVLEQCARTVMRLHPDTLHLAVDCFKSLSCALRGKVAFSSNERFSEAKTLAAVLPSSNDLQLHRNILVLSDAEVQHLFKCHMNRNDDIWCWAHDLWSEKQDEATSFDVWICRITPALLVCLYRQEETLTNNVSSSFLTRCQRLSCLDPSFASEVFQSVSLHLMLADPDDELFNKNRRDQVIEGFTGGLSLVLQSCQEYKDRRYLEIVVDVLDTLRQISQDRFLSDPSKATRGDAKCFRIPFDVFSGLNGLLVATACFKVKRFKQALFYAELYATENIEPLSSQNGAIDEQKSSTETLCSFFRLLFDCYKELRQDDSCSAVEDYRSENSFSTFTGDNYVRIKDSGLNRLEKLDNLTQIDGSWSSHWSLSECLANMDLKATMGNYIEALGQQGECDCFERGAIKEKAAEVRLYKRQWDDFCFKTDNAGHVLHLPSMSASEDHSLGFFGGIDRAFDFLRRDEKDSYQRSLRMARLATLNDLSSTNILNDDSTLDFYASRFNVLNKLDRLGRYPEEASSLIRLDYHGSTNDSLRSPFAFDDDLVEAAVRSFPRHISDNALREGLVDHLEVKFEQSLFRGEKKRCHGILARLRSLHTSYGSIVQDDIACIVGLRLKEARLLEKANDFHSAIRLAKLASKTCMNGSLDVHSWLEQDSNSHLRSYLPIVAEAMTLCGIWTANYRVEPSTFILSYQRAAVEASRAASKIPGGNKSMRTLVKALCAQAELASSLFEASERRRQSIEWQEAGETLIEREETLKTLNKKRRLKTSSGEDHMRYARELTREVEATRRSRNEFEQSIESYRFLSMESSVQALSVANTRSWGEMSKHMYSFVSLMFSCAEDKKWYDKMDTLVAQATDSIPSFRFVGLFSQLLSRLEANSGEQHGTIHQHLIRICNRVACQHPYHCIMQLIALSRSGTNDTTKTRKAEAASQILADLSKSDPEFKGEMIRIQSYLFDAYVHLALASSDQFQRGASQKISFDNVCKGSQARLDRLPGITKGEVTSSPCVLTKTPDVRPRCDYGNGVTDPVGSERIKGFETYFTVASSGVSRPKIVVCLGTKGGRFKQLVKGGDDTRQDAVMEQVFQYVNTLLQKQQGSIYHEQLRLATYNVISLTSKAGVRSLPWRRSLFDSRFDRCWSGSIIVQDLLNISPRVSPPMGTVDFACPPPSPAPTNGTTQTNGATQSVMRC